MNNYNNPSPSSILSFINNYQQNLSSFTPTPSLSSVLPPFQSNNIYTSTNTGTLTVVDNNVHHQIIDLSNTTATATAAAAATTTSSITADMKKKNAKNKNIRTSMVLTAIPMYSPYPPVSMIGQIAEHDRPFSEYGHLSNYYYCYYIHLCVCDLDHEMIQHRCRFDLVGIKTATKRFMNNNRMSRKMYAITCHTNIDSKKYFILSFLIKTSDIYCRRIYLK
jgi:hypothetical protein